MAPRFRTVRASSHGSSSADAAGLDARAARELDERTGPLRSVPVASAKKLAPLAVKGVSTRYGFERGSPGRAAGPRWRSGRCRGASEDVERCAGQPPCVDEGLKDLGEPRAQGDPPGQAQGAEGRRVEAVRDPGVSGPRWPGARRRCGPLDRGHNPPRPNRNSTSPPTTLSRTGDGAELPHSKIIPWRVPGVPGSCPLGVSEVPGGRYLDIGMFLYLSCWS